MKWVSVNNNSSVQNYELWDAEKKLVSLSISKSTKITRVESASDKRLFFIEKKGFLHSKTVINNEYGVRLGELTSENWDANEGVITLEGITYSYAFSDDSEAELILYDETKTKPLVHCSLSSFKDDASAVVKKSKSLHDTKYPSLLMALCWYLLKAAGAEAKSMA